MADLLEFGPYELENVTIDYGVILFRHVHNDVNVTNWKPIPDLNETSFEALKEYLRKEYCEDPGLFRTRLFSGMELLEDKHRNQFYGFDYIPENL